MKKTFLIIILLTTAAITKAQDTMYVHQSGAVIYKRAITAVDSITFYQAGSGSFTCGGTLTDTRDGKTYSTILIGSQCWMAQNLNIGSKIAGANEQANNSTIEKYCYNDLETNCNVYGGLYQWAETVQYLNGATNTTSWSPVPTGNVQGICPSGWHIPTDAEWCTMENTVEAGTDASCNTTGWRGTATGGKLKEAGSIHWTATNECGGTCNTSGFTALPGGCRFTDGSFNNISYNGSWWTATEYDATTAWYRILDYSTATVYRYGNVKANGFSVRCLKD